MKAFILTTITLLALLATSSSAHAQTCKTTGVSGYITRVTGDQMPSPDAPATEPKGYKTTVYIYQLTNVSQVERKGEEPAYSAIRTKLVRTVSSTAKGYFFARLPKGRYSLFVKVDGLYYANEFDTENNIAAVEVKNCEVAKLNIRVDAGTTY